MTLREYELKLQSQRDELDRTNAELVAQKAALQKLADEHARLRKTYQQVLLELEKLKRGVVGPKSERIKQAEQQLSLLEALLSSMPPIGATESDGADTEPQAPAHKTKKRAPHGRRHPESLEHLPTVTIRLEPALDETQRAELEQVDVEVSESIEYRAAGFVRLRVERPKYVKKTPQGKTFMIADLPERGIHRCLAAPSLCAHVLVSKFADHLPLHRQERIFRRQGLHLPRSTLGDWVQASHALLKHVVDAMWQEAKTSDWISIDATGILIQAKDQCRRKSFFVLVAQRDHVLFHAAQREDRFEPLSLLGGYRGYVLADASAIYHELYRCNAGIVEVGCWAHARRKFFDALSTDREAALRGLALISKLYQAHDATKQADGTWHVQNRARLAQAVLDPLYVWVEQATAQPDDKTPLRLALNYLRNHKEPLTRFLGDGRLRLDNNLSELELRRQVLGRKNWLFCGSDDAAHWNTTIVSLIASCALHDIEPWAYLKDVLTLLPSWPTSRALELSPKHWLRTSQQPDVQAALARLDLLARAAPP
jgi:transposase